MEAFAVNNDACNTGGDSDVPGGGIQLPCGAQAGAQLPCGAVACRR